MADDFTVAMLMIFVFAFGFVVGRRVESVARRSRIANNAAAVARARGKDPKRHFRGLRAKAFESGGTDIIVEMQTELAAMRKRERGEI